MKFSEIKEILTANGFDVTWNGGETYRVVSVVTGATIYKDAFHSTLEELARGVNYALTQSLDRTFKSPIRETGRYLVK